MCWRFDERSLNGVLHRNVTFRCLNEAGRDQCVYDLLSSVIKLGFSFSWLRVLLAVEVYYVQIAIVCVVRGDCTLVIISLPNSWDFVACYS